MKELTIKYEMNFTCDEWLITHINYEWESALEDIEGDKSEEKIFKIALAYALADNYDVGYNERKVIMTQSHEIYKWWKENKENE